MLFYFLAAACKSEAFDIVRNVPGLGSKGLDTAVSPRRSQNKRQESGLLETMCGGGSGAHREVGVSPQTLRRACLI